LIETNGINADTSQHCGLSDLNHVSHTIKNKPWS
jgi:hypothetical protein